MQSVSHNFDETYSAHPEAVARARHAVARFAHASGAGPSQVEMVRLAVSEAFTNAVVHAYGEQGGEIHVTAAIIGKELWVLIADDGSGLEPKFDRPGLGLGLALIAQLSDHLTIAPRASGGTELRMRFDLVPVAPLPPVGAPDTQARKLLA